MFRLILCVTLFSAAFSQSILERFHEWASTHKIALPESDDAFLHMLENWRNNDLIIKETNAKNLSYTLGHNHYSGMNSGEFAELMRFRNNRELFADGASPFGLRGSSLEVGSGSQALVGSLPASVDWRTANAVTAVKNQMQCGSCWSFSSTGSLEGAYAIKYGKLVSYSEQQLVDCDNIKNGVSHGNLGCSGGNMEPTLQWIGKNGGICTEADYPYFSGTTGSAGPCKTTCSKVSASAVTKTVEVAPNSDSAMMAALAQQPVSVAIEADQSAFQLYKSGVFTAPCGTNLDHGVLLVGYGTMNGLDYYTMKNSWGGSSGSGNEGWGDQGYMYMGRGVDPATGKLYNQGAGQCGVLSQGVYPVL
jgi:KDEL-tailed cysteine endopeptidase